MRAYLLECKPYDPVTASVKDVRFSSGLADEGSLGNIPYPVRLRSTFTHEISVFPENIPGGEQVTIGSIQINNTDGRFDYLLDYAWGGRELVLKEGPAEGPYSAFTTLFSGSSLDITADQKDLTIVVRDVSWRTAVNLQDNRYTGGGGKEGPPELANVQKPLCLSAFKNAAPVLVDPALLTYQVHDGAIQSVSGVFDSGISLTFSADYPSYYSLVSANIPSGSYATCLTEGFVRLGAAPEGDVTADGVGRFSASTTLADIMKAVLTDKVLTTADLNLTSFSELASDFPFQVQGLYYPEPTMQMDEWLSNVVATANAFWFVDQSNKLNVRQFKFRAPSQSIRREDIVALQRTTSSRPVTKLIVQYDRNSFVQQTESFVLGYQALQGYLKDSKIFVATDAAGNGGDYSYVGQFTVFLDDVDVTDLGVITFQNRSGASWLTMSPNGSFTITDPGADQASCVLRASLNEFYVEEIFTVKKSKGSLPRNITLSATGRHFDYDQYNVPLNNTQSVDVAVTSSNVTGLTWSAKDNLGNIVPLVGSGGSRSVLLSGLSSSALLSSVIVTVSSAEGEFNSLKLITTRKSPGYGFQPGSTRNQPRGLWSGGGVKYFVGDTVLYEGSSFQCVSDHTSSVLLPPVDGDGRWITLAAKGADGSGGQAGPSLYLWIAYADSADGTVNFTTGANTGQQYIGVSENHSSPVESQNPNDYVWSKIKGDQGIQGQSGYIWIAYADSADGTVNFTTGAPGGRSYIGITTNRTTEVESTNPNDYYWSLMKGADAIVGYLTNETHTVAADSAGNVSSFSNAGGVFRVHLGTNDVTGSGPVYSLVASSGVTVSINSTTGVYTVSAMSADQGTATLRAIYSGVTIDRVYSIAKSKEGVSGGGGTSAKLLNITSDRQTITYDNQDNLSPASQTTTFTAYKQNTSNTVTWSMYRSDGTALDASLYLSATTGDVVTMSAASFNTARGSTQGVIVRATLSDGVTLIDQISVVRVREGPTGPAAKALFVFSDRQQVSLDSSGNPSPAGQTTTFSVIRQNTSAPVTWTMKRGDGVALNAALYLSATTGDVVTMSSASFNTARGNTEGVVVIGTLTDGGTFTDQVSVVRVQQGQAGTDGSVAWNAVLNQMSRNGSTLTALSAGWAAYALSSEAFSQARTGGTVVGATKVWMTGLRDPSSGSYYMMYAYGADAGGTGTVYTDVNDSSYANTGVAIADGMRLEVAHVGTEIRGFINGVDVGFPIATGVPADKALTAYFRMWNAGGQIANTFFTKTGNPGTDSLSMELSIYSLTFAADYQGVVKAGQQPKTFKVRILKGATDVTSSSSISLTASGCTASYDPATGNVTVDNVSSSGYVDVTATYSSVGIPAKKCSVVKTLDPAPPATPSSQSNGISASVSSTLYPATLPQSGTGILTVKTRPDGGIYVSEYVEFGFSTQDLQSHRYFYLAGQFYYRLAGSGGAWTPLGSEVVSQQEARFQWFSKDFSGEFTPGFLQMSGQFFLSGSTDYEFCVAFRKYSGTQNLVSASGTFTVSQT